MLKGARKTNKSKAKEQQRRFLSMLLGTLAANFLGDMLVARAREGVIRAANGVFLVG